MHKVALGSIVFGNPGKLVLIGGSCVIEDEKSTLRLAEKISKITRRLKIPYVFKASFDKANRSSIRSFRGPGLEKGLKILARVKKEFKLPILTDFHTPEQAGRWPKSRIFSRSRRSFAVRPIFCSRLRQREES